MSESQGMLFDVTAHGFTPKAAPCQSHSPTSVAAAAAQTQEKLAGDRLKVLGFIRSCGARGATDEEGVIGTGLGGSTYRPRRLECFERGFIRKGDKRENAGGYKMQSWVATK